MDVCSFFRQRRERCVIGGSEAQVSPRWGKCKQRRGISEAPSHDASHTKSNPKQNDNNEQTKKTNKMSSFLSSLLCLMLVSTLTNAAPSRCSVGVSSKWQQLLDQRQQHQVQQLPMRGQAHLTNLQVNLEFLVRSCLHVRSMGQFFPS